MESKTEGNTLEKEMSFEDAINELESIVNRLENDDVELASSITLFQRGMELTGVCGKMLNEAESKIVKLIKDVDGQPVEEEFSV